MAACRSWRVLSITTLLGLSSCSSPGDDPIADTRSPDKASLFADPGLVPTRAGERARAELALSGEIEAALAVFPSLRRARVNVQLGNDNDGATVLIAAVSNLATEPASIRTDIKRIANAVMTGIDTKLEVVLTPKAVPREPTRRSPDMPLSLALLGLGLSLGVTLERMRWRIAARIRRRPRHTPRRSS